MQIRNWNSELRIANIMFASLFRNFRITRSQDMENKTVQTIDVPVVIADRSRIFKNLENAYLAASKSDALYDSTEARARTRKAVDECSRVAAEAANRILIHK